MGDFRFVLAHWIVTLFRLAKPGGIRSGIAASVLARHQLIMLNRGRKRAPNLHREIAASPGYARFSSAGHGLSALPSC